MHLDILLRKQTSSQSIVLSHSFSLTNYALGAHHLFLFSQAVSGIKGYEEAVIRT